MTSNIEFSAVTEVTRGITPINPRMRLKRFVSESLTFRPDFTKSEEIRDDRMSEDPIKVGEKNDGSVTIEFSFPVDQSPESEDIRSLFCSDWNNRPVRDNDGAADSAITGVDAATQTVTIVAGAAFPVGALVRFSGFESTNNGMRRCTTTDATAPVFAVSGLVDDAAPAAAARMKMVGLEGAAGDLQAVADGLTATTLDLSTFGIVPGMFLKVGGNGAGCRFVTDACNGYVRVTAVAAGKLTCDHLPAGWAADTGAGKTIRIFIPDQIKNGRTLVSQTFQRRFVGQATPTCYKQRGMVVNTLSLQLQAKDDGGGNKVTGTVTYLGMGGAQDLVNLDAAPDPRTRTRVFATGVNVARVCEYGTRLTAPNFVKELSLEVNNNLAAEGAIDEMGPADIRYGDFDVKVSLVTLFGDNGLLNRVFAGTPTAINVPLAKDNQAVMWQVPRLTYTEDGNPNSSGKNRNVPLKVTGTASQDTLTDAHLILDRFEYLE